MKPTLMGTVAAAILAVCLLLASGVSRAKNPVLQPGKLLIISTTDVKGKTGPCG
jgi:hypothetical protein